MDNIIVAVGSSRRPKLDAVREALAELRLSLDRQPKLDLVAVDVPSGVHHTPLSRAEMMTGARQRAEALVRIARERGAPWKYFVGLEGGVDVVYERDQRLVFLENWAYVADGSGRGAFGQSGAVMLPEALAKRVVDDGVELSEAIDEFAGREGVRDSQGAWGVLTRNLITRQDSVRTSVINAFVPLLHQELYAAQHSPKR